MSEYIFIAKNFLVLLERISLNPETGVLKLVSHDIPCFAVLSNSQCHKCGRKLEMPIWFGSYWILLKKSSTLFAEHIWFDLNVNCHVTQDYKHKWRLFLGWLNTNYDYSRWQVISYLGHKLDRRQVQMWARRAKSLNLSVSALMATSLACSLFSSSPWNVVEHLDEKSTEQVRR